MTATKPQVDTLPDAQQFAVLGQTFMLDVLRAEMGALQAIMPGIVASHVDARSMQSQQDQDEFDNMPV